MHGDNAFLQDLAVVMIVAGLVTVVFHLLRQPVVLGYILAGLIVGPHTKIPLGIHDPHVVAVWSELGVIFLMFSLGLHFSLRQLARVGATAVIAATLEILLMVWAGYLVGRFFGWGTMDSLFLGAILSISSTTIIVKALGELGKLKERFADLIFGILIVEDILAIAMLALLSGIAVKGTVEAGEVLRTLGGLGTYLACILVFGLLLVPPLLRFVSRFKSNEMLLVTVLGVCFGVCLLTVLREYSVALGAFLVGAIVAEAREHGKIETLVEPIRDMFSAVFFVGVGTLIDPALMLKYAVPIAVITVAVVVGKVVACGLGTLLAGNPPKTALKVGMGLAQIGEFSFIIAQLGQQKHVTSEFLYPIAVTVSAVTTLLTPYLIKSADTVADVIGRVVPDSFADTFSLYRRWLSNPDRGRGGAHGVPRLIRKWLLQMGLNVFLVSGLLLLASSVGRRVNDWWPDMPRWGGGMRTLVWVAAMLLSLPLLVAIGRKLRATAMVLAELTVTRAAAGEQTVALRGVVANVILFSGLAALGIWVLALGSAILPPWPVFLVLLLALAATAIVMWRRLVRVYARAEIALRATLAETPSEPAPPERTFPSLLRDALIESVALDGATPGTGRLIRELQLRSNTGASAVGIERETDAILNPGPDEELQAGDRVLLLGNRAQLDAARRLLAGM